MVARRSRPKMEDKGKQIAQCNTCKEWKSFSEFSIIRKSETRRVTQSSCKSCCSAWKKADTKRVRAEYAEEELALGSKKCNACGITKPLSEMTKYRGSHYMCVYKPKCKSCLNIQQKENRIKRYARTGSWSIRVNATTRGRAMTLFRTTKSRCTHAGIQFTLTKDWFFERIEKTCEATGLSYSIKPGSPRRNLFAPSIDRIDPDLGYTPENCKLVVLGYNLAKNDGSHADVLKMATALVQFETRI